MSRRIYRPILWGVGILGAFWFVISGGIILWAVVALLTGLWYTK